MVRFSTPNYLLKSLPEDLLLAMEPSMKRVTLDRMARLTKSDLLNDVYFSEGCLFSVVINVEGGMTVEVSTSRP